MSTTAKCDMSHDCTAPVTHIGEKGYIYCTEHAINRRICGVEYTRKLRKWEIAHIERAIPLISYKPITKRADTQRRQEQVA